MRIFISLILLVLMAGCSDFKSPTQNLTVESVVGGGPSLAVGMTQDDVLSKWGHPDEKKQAGDTRWGAPKEIWIYRAWFPAVPVDYRYVSKGRRLFFEGDSLVRWEEIAEGHSDAKPDGQKNEDPKR